MLVAERRLLNSAAAVPALPIPLLSEIPIIGPVLFRQTIIVYIMYIAVFLVWFGLFKTRWGLRLRAVGEHPTGGRHRRHQRQAHPVLERLARRSDRRARRRVLHARTGRAFNKEMTNGAGFIALAAVIFGRWDPIRATLAGLLFGFATNLQSVSGSSARRCPASSC